MKKEKVMIVDELIKYLKEQEGNNVILELEGIIETTIMINKIEIQELDKYLTIKSKEDSKQNIKINLHQLMKTNTLNENEILLEFDQLQTIKIILFS